MNKSVPTLLGIVIILLVVVLVVLIFTYKMTDQMSKGGIPVGTVGGQALTGVQAPTEEISPSEALAARQSKTEPVVINPMSAKPERTSGERRKKAAAAESAKPTEGK